LEGKTPFEALPPRMAENVQAKYLTCLRSQAPSPMKRCCSFLPVSLVADHSVADDFR
jgi:hypothetical protein